MNQNAREAHHTHENIGLAASWYSRIRAIFGIGFVVYCSLLHSAILESSGSPFIFYLIFPQFKCMLWLGHHRSLQMIDNAFGPWLVNSMVSWPVILD